MKFLLKSSEEAVKFLLMCFTLSQKKKCISCQLAAKVRHSFLLSCFPTTSCVLLKLHRTAHHAHRLQAPRLNHNPVYQIIVKVKTAAVGHGKIQYFYSDSLLEVETSPWCVRQKTTQRWGVFAPESPWASLGSLNLAWPTLSQLQGIQTKNSTWLKKTKTKTKTGCAGGGLLL